MLLKKISIVLLILSLSAVSFSCSKKENKKEVATTTSTTQTTTKSDKTSFVSSLDKTKIPLGDGKVSSSPQKGSVYSCQTNFNPNAGGASQDGDWINGSTWDLTSKISVLGSNSWPNASFNISKNESRNLVGNKVPTDHGTGNFPVSSSDPAYQIDRNPNKIATGTLNISVPLNPTIATSPSCVNMGAVGYSLNGVAIFNALDGRGDDAVAHEVQDKCSGHPERTGEYHYHGPSSCTSSGQEKKHVLAGYALDGFGIFGIYDQNGKEIVNSDLDECHGHTHEIEWDGKKVSMYHYHFTNEYPYTIACFKGQK